MKEVQKISKKSEETFIKIGAQGIFSGKSFEGAVWFSVSIDLCATWKPIKLSSVQQLLATLVVLSKGAFIILIYRVPLLCDFYQQVSALFQIRNLKKNYSENQNFI